MAADPMTTLREPKRILFVDDEPALLTLMKVFCQRLGEGWEAEVADSGARGLELLEAKSFDVVVSDMRMPGMNGVEFLQRVVERQPHTARIVLSGFAEQHLVLRSLGATHQYLTKPCDFGLLRSTIERLLALRGLLASDSLRGLVAKIQALPTLPSLYYRLMRELGSSEATTEQVAAIIREDVSLTAKLLQLTNSAFFGVAHPASTVAEAVQILGFSMVKTLALTIYVFSRFEPERLPGFPIDRLWRHSMATGLLARRIAAAERAGIETVENAFTGGVLHDVGKLVLRCCLPELHRKATERAIERGMPCWKAEQEVIGAAHPEVGAYLLGLWGLPAPLVNAVAWHHAPGRSGTAGFTALTAVHLANAVQARETPSAEVPLPAELDRTYLEGLGSDGDLLRWVEHAEAA